MNVGSLDWLQEGRLFRIPENSSEIVTETFFFVYFFVNVKCTEDLLPTFLTGNNP